MHLGFDFKADCFEISKDGEACSPASLLDWELRDRLGVVVDRPLGLLDAGLMVVLAGVSFYDADGRRRRRRVYPDSYIFHLGGPWGSFSGFDFAPLHKEVFVADGADLLTQINHVGITHLLVPDREPKDCQHRFTEPSAAVDRIKRAFIYGELGTVAGTDVVLATDQFDKFARTYEYAMWPEKMVELGQQVMSSGRKTSQEAGFRIVDDEFSQQLIASEASRLNEVPRDHPEWTRHTSRFNAAKKSGRLAERYRTIDVAASLALLY
jgi:hypothetical protein